MQNDKTATDTKFTPAQAVNPGALVEYQTGSVVSREILKKPAGRVTLFAFDADEGLSEHTSPFDALAQVLEGEAEITIAGKPNQVRQGERRGDDRQQRADQQAGQEPAGVAHPVHFFVVSFEISVVHTIVSFV